MHSATSLIVTIVENMQSLDGSLSNKEQLEQNTNDLYTERILYSLLSWQSDRFDNHCHDLNTCTTSYQEATVIIPGLVEQGCVAVAFHALLAECRDLGGGHGNWAEIIYSRWGAWQRPLL